MTTLQVLGKDISINVRKVLWTCTELQLAFEHSGWGEGDLKLRDPAFLALNPNALVPVIRDGDFIMWESNSIIRYLANEYGSTNLYPTSPRLRARVDQWIDWQSSDLNRAWIYAFMGLVKHSPAHRDPDEIAASEAAWTHHIQILNQQLEATGAYVAGKEFSLADIPMGLSVHRWMNAPVAHPPMHGIHEYLARLSEREGFQRYCAPGFP